MFTKSIKELNEIVKKTAEDIVICHEKSLNIEDLYNPAEPIYIKELENIIINHNQTNTIIYTILLVENIKKLDLEDYFKTKVFGNIAKILYTKIHCNKSIKLSKDAQGSIYYTLHKFAINEAVKIADLPTLYGIAGDCFRITGDFEFTVQTYKKAIDWCYKINNTSRLYLLGYDMVSLDNKGEYFNKWGNEIMKEAKRLSDEQKLKAKLTK